MALQIGVVLSGCGFLDGSEIIESVSVLIAVDRRGAEAVCMAPLGNQAEVINHLTKQLTGQTRDILSESARIARGKIRDIAEVMPAELDALVFPGGFGAAKNLSTFAVDRQNCTVNKDVERLIVAMHQEQKPIGLACIAPCLAAAVLGRIGAHPHLTIGSDPSIAADLESMGAVHHPVGPTEAHVDRDNKLVSTACYMNDVGPWTVFSGAEQMVEQVIRMTGDRSAAIRAQTAVIRPQRQEVI